MAFLLLAFIIFLSGGVLSAIAGRGKTALIIGPYSAALGCILALYPVVSILLGLTPPLFCTFPVYPLPAGEIILKLDKLSALFLVPTLTVSFFCAVFGSSYLVRGVPQDKNLGVHWFYYNILIFALIMTFISADAFLFLVSWEIMSVTPFFLIIFNDELEQVRKGAWSYLIASNIGALFLLTFFLLLSSKNGGSLDFFTFTTNAGSFDAGGLFIFALVGFGVKAGLMPVHVWLPEAHPAAPGHISAVMSGVMINTGIYGIIRVLSFLGYGESWWSFILICVGGFSAILGIFFAISEKSIKRILAFSSIENMGIVCMAVGFALYSVQLGNTALGLFCLMGGMFHLVNHSLYKSLLFLVAGNISKGTGSDLLNRLGGLMKKAPVLGMCFFAGACAICALPPLNGFAGEFILYMSYAVGGAVSREGYVYWLGIFVLASVSGFSLFCFARVFGIAFLGNPRTSSVSELQPAPFTERFALLGITAVCFISAFLAPFAAKVLSGALGEYIYSVAGVSFIQNPTLITPYSAAEKEISISLADLFNILKYVNAGFVLFIFTGLFLYIRRRKLVRLRQIAHSPTWDCGYAAPSSRMQYTGGSFSQPAIYFMGFLLRPRAVIAHFASNFPSVGKAEFVTEDWMKSSIYGRIFKIIARVALWAKGLQQGRVNAYILYIFVTLVVLLAWKIR